MKFTDEEIRLCKLIAEKERKEIKHGDWIYHEPYKNYFLVVNSVIFQYQIQGGKWFDKQKKESRKINTPLWTLSDAIEWLKKKGWWARIDLGIDDTRIYMFHEDLPFKNWNKYPMYKGKTFLEACLKAVLAILKE